MVAGVWVTCWLLGWVWALCSGGFAKALAAGRGGFRKKRHGVTCYRTRRKPDWVLTELIKLKAHMPDAGCRTLALTFNRLFASRQMSVCKSTVHKLLRDQAHAVLQARRELRNKPPYPHAVNDVWALDMTGRADRTGQVHTILGIVDHGSRRALMVQAIASKSSWQLLSWLCLTIDQFGKPKAVRTDNERCFTGVVFTLGLKLLGIRHQRIELGCPWQNGRVERFFGTLKRYLKQIQFDNKTALEGLLKDFAYWYNQIRPHQNLGGLTPLEAWNGVDAFDPSQPPKEIRFVQYWDGLLCGFHIRR